MRDDDRIRANRCTQLLGHPIHTILYTIPTLPTAPPQERKLPEGEFCTEPGSSFTVPDAGVLVRKLRQLTPLSDAKPANPKCFMLLCRISCDLARCVHQPIVSSESTIVG